MALPLSAGRIFMSVHFLRLCRAFLSSGVKLDLGGLEFFTALDTSFLRLVAFSSLKSLHANSVAKMMSSTGSCLGVTAKLRPFYRSDSSSGSNLRVDALITHLFFNSFASWSALTLSLGEFCFKSFWILT